jgi:hypothetical protein
MHSARRRLLPHLVAALGLLAAGLDAQFPGQNVVYTPDNSPVGSGNAFPFGSVGIRYQTLVPAATFNTPVATIKDIFIAGRTTNLEVEYDDIEIRMGMTSLTTLTNNWTTNNPNPTTVYRGPLRVRMVIGAWNGIGLPNPYLYLPLPSATTLCVEVIVWAASKHTGNFYYPAAGAQPRAYLNNWVSSQSPTANVGTSLGCKMGFLLDNGNFVAAGQSCLGSNSQMPTVRADTWPKPNQPITISLTGAPASTAALFVLGLDHAKWNGLPLPMDMGFMGAPNCRIWNSIQIQAGLATDPSGNSQLKLTVPNGPTSGTIFGHFWVLDTQANNAGLITSDQATIILGS